MGTGVGTSVGKGKDKGYGHRHRHGYECNSMCWSTSGRTRSYFPLLVCSLNASFPQTRDCLGATPDDPRNKPILDFFSTV